MVQPRRADLASLIVGGLTAVLVAVPRLAAAQDVTPIAVAASQLVDQGTIERPTVSRPAVLLALPPARHLSFVMESFYVSTAIVQGLDAHSTFRALDAGAIEANSLVKPFAANRPAFIALKAGMAAAFIYAGHDLSTRHKVGAIVALGLVNSVYTAIVLHNYHLVQVLDARR